MVLNAKSGVRAARGGQWEGGEGGGRAGFGIAESEASGKKNVLKRES